MTKYLVHADITSDNIGGIVNALADLLQEEVSNGKVNETATQCYNIMATGLKGMAREQSKMDRLFHLYVMNEIISK